MQTATQHALNKKPAKASPAIIRKTKPLAQTTPAESAPKEENNLQRLLASCCDCV